jgi:hypothetical protein
MEGRKEKGATKFRFEIENLPIKWTLEQRTRLGQLKEGGFDLELMQDGRKVIF